MLVDVDDHRRVRKATRVSSIRHESRRFLVEELIDVLAEPRGMQSALRR